MTTNVLLVATATHARHVGGAREGFRNQRHLRTHFGATFDVNLGAALHAAVNGLPSPTRSDLDPGEEHFAVHFPHEWVRDPASRYLREYPVDVPWDEPELVEAIVAQVMENFRGA